jgi:hypothetical protein
MPGDLEAGDDQAEEQLQNKESKASDKQDRACKDSGEDEASASGNGQDDEGEEEDVDQVVHGNSPCPVTLQPASRSQDFSVDRCRVAGYEATPPPHNTSWEKL